jgi:hypothetical protein
MESVADDQEVRHTAAMNPYRKIFGALNDAQVQYVIVGGVAMNLLGYPRFTGDIDILLALDPGNLKRMGALMATLGYERRVPVRVEELGDEQNVLRLMKEKNLIAYTFANPDAPLFSIDVIVGESLHFATFQQRASVLKVWDILLPVVSVDDLIEMKRKTTRKKDADDVQNLLELKGL